MLKRASEHQTMSEHFKYIKKVPGGSKVGTGNVLEKRSKSEMRSSKPMVKNHRLKKTPSIKDADVQALIKKYPSVKKEDTSKEPSIHKV